MRTGFKSRLAAQCLQKRHYASSDCLRQAVSIFQFEFPLWWLGGNDEPNETFPLKINAAAIGSKGHFIRARPSGFASSCRPAVIGPSVLVAISTILPEFRFAFVLSECALSVDSLASRGGY